MAKRQLSKKIKVPAVNDLLNIANAMIQELPEPTNKTTIEFVNKYF